MDVIDAKVIAMLTIGFGSMLAGMLPIAFSSNGRQVRSLYLSSLLCFGGGVLLSTSVVHMLPEVRESMLSYRHYTELIFCIGFFLIYAVDELVHFFIGDIHNHNSHPRLLSDHYNGMLLRRHSYSYTRKHGYGTVETDSLILGEPHQRQPAFNPNYATVPYGQEEYQNDAVPSQLCHVGHQEPCEVSTVGTLGLLLGLSIHAVLEGLAVGMQRSGNQVMLLLSAICSHKLVVSFCLGNELSSNRSSVCRHIVYVAVFSFGSVLGILAGMVVDKIPSKTLQVTFPILQGLAGGTLLYVTVSEVLPRERARWHKQNGHRSAGIIQFLSVLIGFLLMTVVTTYLDFEHHN